MQRKVPSSVSAGYRCIEDHAFRGPFAMGEDDTIADPYLFTIAQWMEGDGVDVEDFPVVAHRAMMAGRSTVQAALAAEKSADDAA